MSLSKSHSSIVVIIIFDIFNLLGITTKFDGSEDQKINPRIMKFEEIRGEIESTLFSKPEDDSDLEPLLTEFYERFSQQVTYEREKATQEVNGKQVPPTGFWPIKELKT